MNTNRTISFEFKGLDTGHLYKGTFVTKISLTKREAFAADEFRRRALGVNSSEAPNALQTDAYIAGQLYSYLVEAPKWWKDSDSGLDLPQEDGVLYAVYDAVLVEIQKFKDERSNKAQELVKELD